MALGVAAAYTYAPVVIRTAKAAPGSPATLTCSANFNGTRWDVTVDWSFIHNPAPYPYGTPYAMGVQGHGDGTMGAAGESGSASFSFLASAAPFTAMIYSNYTDEEMDAGCGGAPIAPPTVTLSASPSLGVYPTFAGLSWSTTNNPTSCTAGGDWSGSKSISGGSETVGYPSAGHHEYTISCTNDGGTANASASIDISAPGPTVTLTATPNPVAYNATTTLGWSSDYTSECVATQGPGFSTGAGSPTSGSDVSTALTSATTFTVFCDGPQGSVSDTQVVNVQPHCTSSAAATPTVSIAAGTQYVYAYGVVNATSVSFPTWGDVNGQNDIIWYTGTDLGGGTWRATVSLNSHSPGSPEYGNINSHVYMSGSGYTNTWCGTANFTLNSSPVVAQMYTRVSGTTPWLKSVVVAPGTQVDYMWTSAGGSSYSSTYTANPFATYCGSVPPTGGWIANSSSGTSLNNTTQACQNGIVFTLLYSVNGGAATDSVTVTVSSTGSVPTGSLTVSQTPNCTVTPPATTCDPTPAVNWATTNTVYSQVLVSVNGGADSLFNAGCAASGGPLDRVVASGETHTFKLYAAPNCFDSPGGSLTGDITVLWDSANGAIPSGWTCISCNPGDAYYHYFLRGDSTAGTTGGSDTGSHTLTYQSATSGSSTLAPSGSKAAGSSHWHSWPNLSTTSDSIVPAYKHLELIKRTNPPYIPANAIALFEGSVPSGWTRYASADGLYLRGGENNATGGSATHTHTTVANVSGAPSGSSEGGGTSGRIPASTFHTHTLDATSVSASNNSPPYVQVVLGKISANGPAPAGMVALFDGSIPTGWSCVSCAAGDVYYQRLLVGAANFGSTGGVATHDHGGSLVITSGGPSGTTSTAATSGNSPASSSHAHAVTYTVDAQSSWPAYKTIKLGRYTAFTLLDTKSVTGVTAVSPAILVSSNKDVVAVDGAALPFAYNDAVANANIIQSVGEGSTVTFAIHIRNTGPGTVSGGFTIEDTIANLVKGTTDWGVQLYCNDSTLTLSASCNAKYSVSTPVSYNAGTGKITFVINSIGGSLATNDFISLVYSAKAQGATGTSSSIFRFKNEAKINYTDPVNGASYVDCSSGGSTCPLRTPAVLFFRDLFIPFLQER